MPLFGPEIGRGPNEIHSYHSREADRYAIKLAEPLSTTASGAAGLGVLTRDGSADIFPEASSKAVLR